MLKSDSENPAAVLATTAELASGVNNINRDLFPELIRIYDLVQDLWELLPIRTDDETPIQETPVYKIRGLVFDLMVSLGYESRYDKWNMQDMFNKGYLNDEEKQWAKEKYGIQGATNEK